MSAVQEQEGSVVSASLAELIRLSEQARQLQLRPQLVRARQSGQHVSRLRGRGMEFDESRPYQPGDDVRNMDWRVTARIGKPYSKLFREERERPVLIGVDARASMFFATRGRFKWAQAQRLAALLAWTALQGGDRVGGEIWWESGFRELRPRRGKASLLRFLKVLADQSPVSSQGHHSLAPPFRRMRRTVHPGSLVIFISDFRGFDQPAEQQLVRIARHNDVLLLHVHDWLEQYLPEQGHYRLGDGERIVELETGRKQLRSRYRQAFETRIARLQHLCRQYHVSWLQCATDEEPLEVLRRVYGRNRP